MANVIALRKQYSTLLDEVYKLSSLTSVLDGPNDLVREGANANEILIPKMSMQGLANYSKQTDYVDGDVTLEYETKKCTYDRGRMFSVDAMDNIESQVLPLADYPVNSSEQKLFRSWMHGDWHLMRRLMV